MGVGYQVSRLALYDIWRSQPGCRRLERSCSPTVGSCPGQFTANTMAMVGEALGLSPLGSAMLPAIYSERLALKMAKGTLQADGSLKNEPTLSWRSRWARRPRRLRPNAPGNRRYLIECEAYACFVGDRRNAQCRVSRASGRSDSSAGVLEALSGYQLSRKRAAPLERSHDEATGLSRAVALVRPMTACLDAVYAIIPGRGTVAAIDPLLMMRPPRGVCWLMSTAARGRTLIDLDQAPSS
jgi:hypothetical protein